MIWLKRCTVPILPHEALIANVVYPAFLLAFSRSLVLLLVMVGCIQSGFQVLTKSFCRVETLVDEEGNVLVD